MLAKQAAHFSAQKLKKAFEEHPLLQGSPQNKPTDLWLTGPCEQNSIAVGSTATQLHTHRQSFRLPSVLPASDLNPFLNHVYALGRAIESSRDATVDILLHPIEHESNLTKTASSSNSQVIVPHHSTNPPFGQTA